MNNLFIKNTTLAIIRIPSNRNISVIVWLVLIIKWNNDANTIGPAKKTNRKVLRFLSDAMTPINKPEMIITGSVVIAISPPDKDPTKPELVAIPITKIRTCATKIAEGIIHNFFI